MSVQTSDHLPKLSTPSSLARDKPNTIWQRWFESPGPNLPLPIGFWVLLTVAMLLNLVVLGLAVYLLSTGRPIAPPAREKIFLPYAACTDLHA